MSIRELRAQPLLEAPARVEPLVPNDVEEAVVGFVRGGGWREGFSLAAMLCYAQKLRIPLAKTRRDEEDMREGLRVYRDGNPTMWTVHAFGDFLVNAKALGVAVAPTEAEEARLKAELDEARGKGKGYDVAHMHYILRGSGIGSDVNASDEGMMLAALRGHRAAGRDWGVLRIHYWMMRAGVPEKVTSADRASIRRRLAEVDAGDPEVLAEAHYMHASLFSGEEKRLAAPDIPPLKRFRI